MKRLLSGFMFVIAMFVVMSSGSVQAADPLFSADTKITIDSAGKTTLNWVLTTSVTTSDSISISVTKLAPMGRGYTFVTSATNIEGQRGALVIPGAALGDKLSLQLSKRGTGAMGGRIELTVEAATSGGVTVPRLATGIKVEVTPEKKGRLVWVLTQAAVKADTYTIKVREKGTRALTDKITTGVLEGTTGSVVMDDITAGMTYRLELLKNGTATGSTTEVVAASVAGSSTTPASGSSLLTNCDQNNASGFVFCNTLFGDKVTAQDYLSRFYAWAVGLAVLGAAGMIVWAGYRYTTSRGNPSEANAAREMIVSALVGLALLLLSYTILRFLGVNLA